MAGEWLIEGFEHAGMQSNWYNLMCYSVLRAIHDMGGLDVLPQLGAL